MYAAYIVDETKPDADPDPDPLPSPGTLLLLGLGFATMGWSAGGQRRG